MNKKQIQSEQTKKRIADAARALFTLKGYKATSIEDIVEATGSSKGNIYYHFKSKEGLFLHLIDEWDQEWEVKWKQKESQYKTTTEKLFQIAEELVLDDLNHPLTKAADEFFYTEEITPEAEERIAEMVARHLVFYQDLLQDGIQQGEFKSLNVEYMAIILESLTYGLNQMSRKSTLEEKLGLYRMAIQVVLHGIATES